MGILLLISFDRIGGLRIIDQSIPLNDMQCVRERRAVHIEHGIRTALDPDRIDHEGVAAFVMSDGIAIPRWRHMRRVLRVEAYEAQLLAMAIDKSDVIFRRQ